MNLFNKNNRWPPPPPPHGAGSAYRPDIDGLRAIAVLLVIGFHAFPFRVKGGFIGVDIFFVISGYLIATIIFNGLENGSFSFFSFYVRRIRRIYPTLLAVFIASLAFAWFALLPDEYRQLGKHIAGGAGFISNFVLWRESGYFDVAGETKPLLHLWSLGIEEQFYIVFPFLLWVAWRKRFNLLTLLVSVCTISLVLNLLTYRKNLVADFYSPQTRIWELLAGAVLAHLVLHPPAILVSLSGKLDRVLRKMIYRPDNADSATPPDGATLRHVLASLGVLLIAVALFRLTKTSHFPGKWAVLPVLGTLCLIASGEKAWVNRLLSYRALVWIGLISYPLYLWHYPLLSFAHIINAGIPPRLIRIGAVLASFGLAGATYWLVERPLRFGQYGRAKAVGLFIVMSAVGGAGLTVFLKQGLPKRPPVAAYPAAVSGWEWWTWDKVQKTVADGNRYAPDLPERPSGFGETVTPVKKQYTDVQSDITVAILGDSHAPHAYLGVSEANTLLGVNTFVVAKTGLPLPGMADVFPVSKEVKKIYLRDMDAIFGTLTRKKDIKAVFIVTRGMPYLTKKIPPQPFQSALQEATDRLRREGKKVFIVEENPTLPYDIRMRVARPFRTTPSLSPLKKSSVRQANEPYLRILNTVEGATIVPTTDAFCPGEECLAFDNKGVPLYIDRDHLSLAGSRFQAERVLKPYLEAIARQYGKIK
ncbi:MAG: acyltransferase [Burkholderiaceae bacterium]|nr:acyltransferase [Burkholderiaceae bacterium]